MEFLLSLLLTILGGLSLAGILAAIKALFRKGEEVPSKPETQLQSGAPAAEKSIRASLREEIYLMERRRDEISDDIESRQNQGKHLDLDIREVTDCQH